MPEPRDHRELRIPLGGLSRHAVRRRRLRSALSYWPWFAAALGTAAAAAGVLLATAEPHVTAGLDDGGYRLDGQILRDQGGGAYVGQGGAALVIERRPQGLVAGASAVTDGRRVAGSCQPAGDGETCRFTVDGSELTATDERTDYGWHRRYSDGRTVAITLPGGRDAPVPFIVGR